MSVYGMCADAVSGAAGVVLAGNMMLGQVDKRFTPQALSLDQNRAYITWPLCGPTS